MREACMYSAKGDDRICGRALADSRSPLRLLAISLGFSAEMLLCVDHEMLLIGLIEPFISSKITVADDPALLHTLSRADDIISHPEEDLDQATIRAGLNLMKAMNILPAEFRVPLQGPLGNKRINIFFLNKHRLPANWLGQALVL